MLLHKLKSISLPYYLLVLAFFVRVFLLQNVASWGHDNSRDMVLIFKLFNYGEMIWRGPVFSVVWGFLSPVYYYILAPFFWLSNYNPISSGALTLVLNFITLVILYLVVKDLYGKKAGTISVIIYGFSFRVIIEGAYGLNPNFLPPFVLLSFFLLNKVSSTKKAYYLYFLFLCFTGLISFHPSGFFIFLSSIILLIYLKPNFEFKTWLKSVSIFIVTGIFPYLVVEKKFNFWNTTQIVKYLRGDTDSISEKVDIISSFLNYLFIVLKNVSLMFFNSIDKPYFFVSLFILLVVIFISWDIKKTQNETLLYIFLGCNLILMGLSINYRHEQFLEPWIFNSILPLLLILFSANLAKLSNLLLYFAIPFFIFINFHHLVSYKPPLDTYFTSQKVSKFLLKDSGYQLFDVYGTDDQPINYMVWYYAPEEFKEDYFTKVKWEGEKDSKIVYYLHSYDSSNLPRQKINEVIEKRDLKYFEFLSTVNNSVEVYRLY